MFTYLSLISSWDSVVGIATSYRLDDRGVGVQVPVRSRIFFLHVVQSGSGVHRRVKLTTHLQLMQRSRKCGSMHPLPHTPSWLTA
jgi:hypothetical protein